MARGNVESRIPGNNGAAQRKSQVKQRALTNDGMRSIPAFLERASH
jgi:hypothetical protein